MCFTISTNGDKPQIAFRGSTKKEHLNLTSTSISLHYGWPRNVNRLYSWQGSFTEYCILCWSMKASSLSDIHTTAKGKQHWKVVHVYAFEMRSSTFHIQHYARMIWVLIRLRNVNIVWWYITYIYIATCFGRTIVYATLISSYDINVA
jgi:hypothetical protein